MCLLICHPAGIHIRTRQTHEKNKVNCRAAYRPMTRCIRLHFCFFFRYLRISGLWQSNPPSFLFYGILLAHGRRTSRNLKSLTPRLKGLWSDYAHIHTIYFLEWYIFKQKPAICKGSRAKKLIKFQNEGANGSRKKVLRHYALLFQK